MVTEPVTIAVVDDHTLFRQALCDLLASSPELEVVGSAETPQEAVEVAAAHQPQVMLLDLELGEESGTDLIGRLKEASPQTRVLILSAHGTAHDLQTAMQAGASGYLMKGVTAGQLVDGLRRVVAGDAVLDPALVPMLVDHLSGPQSAVSALTVREHEVITAVASGRTNAAVARELGISTRTVQKHLENIYQKLGVSSRTELVQYAFRQGLLR